MFFILSVLNKCSI